MKKRIAITILYESLHHLTHNDFAEFITKNFDHWIVVEGLAGNAGSTGWCNDMNLPHRSNDGTHEFMVEWAKEHPTVIYYSPGTKWASKDEMATKAIKLIEENQLAEKAWIWQVDSDEQWNLNDIDTSEKQLMESGKKVAAYQFNHFVKNYVAKGKWGSGYVKRLWDWKLGMNFTRHEPPTMNGEGLTIFFGRQKFNHFSYTFESDIKFKEKYYRGYDGLHQMWLDLPDKDILPIRYLFPRSNPIGRTATKLIKNV